MPIAEDYLALLQRSCAQLRLPAVRSVHIPHRTQAVCGSANFGALTLEDGTVGLTYTALDDARDGLLEPGRVQSLAGRPALDVAQLYAGTQAWQRALGMAAINALSQHLFGLGRCTLPPAGHTFEAFELHPGDRLGMVGYFPPLVAQARARGIALTVLELDPQWLDTTDGVEVTLEPARLAGCTRIVCTGTVMINHTIDALAGCFAAARDVLLVGPSVGCLPEPLFARGITQVGGTRVTDGQAFLRNWAAGEKWRGTTQRYLLQRASWTGWDRAGGRNTAPT